MPEIIEVATDTGYMVWKEPYRKQTALYRYADGAYSRVAYFKDEEKAQEFYDWLVKVTKATPEGENTEPIEVEEGDE